MAKLFVIFHGSWAFVDNRSTETVFRACAPKTDAHTYIGGSWLGEVKIRPDSTLVLTGVEPGDEAIRNHPQDTILIPEASGCPQTPYYVQVKLPRPSMIQGEVKLSGVKVIIDGHATSQTYGLVLVFGYNIPAGSTPALTYEGEPQPFWQPFENKEITTLHLFAADDNSSETCIPDDFAAVADLLGWKAVIEDQQQAPAPHARQVLTPELQPYSVEVTTFLHERIHHLRSIGSQMQQKAAARVSDPTLDLLWGAPIPPFVTLMVPAIDYSSCGGGGGGS